VEREVQVEKVEAFKTKSGDVRYWKTAVEAAPLLVDPDEEKIDPEELFERLKPFKDRVAEDIREES
jgi:hypothetical protein